MRRNNNNRIGKKGIGSEGSGKLETGVVAVLNEAHLLTLLPDLSFFRTRYSNASPLACCEYHTYFGTPLLNRIILCSL